MSAPEMLPTEPVAPRPPAPSGRAFTSTCIQESATDNILLRTLLPQN
jgi:hypothetical protein